MRTFLVVVERRFCWLPLFARGPGPLLELVLKHTMALLVAGLLLLGGIGEIAALALSGGREHHHNGTTVTLDPRAFQIAVLSTRLDTIYLSGNPRKSRTADFGFNFRIHGGVWAPCPITVTDPAECMVGSCVDNLLCPDGCGFTDGTLPTIRW